MKKHIRIGNQTARTASSIMLPFKYAVANGFDAFEWFPDKNESGEGWDEKDIDPDTRIYIKMVAMAQDIFLSVHAPWQANPLLSEDCEVLLNQIDFATHIGATILNIHLYNNKGIEAYVNALIPVIKKSILTGIKLAIENTPITDPEDFNKMFALLNKSRGIKGSNIGMCFDIGHANLCASTCNDYLGFLDRLDIEVPIIHTHMHENHGDCDSHMPLFTGPSKDNYAGIQGYIERLIKRKFLGSIILEQWPEPPLLLNEARDRLCDMIEKRIGKTNESSQKNTNI